MTDTAPNEAEPQPTGDEPGRAGGPIIVAVGASGGAPRSLAAFLEAFTPQDHIALVLILHHREALDVSRLREALRDASLTPVTQGALVEGGHIYLQDPDVILTLEDQRFRLRPAQEEPGQRGTIDSLLVSLAEQEGERGVGVVLQGAGSDGTLGFARLKDYGGLTIAEREQGSSAEELAPNSAPSTLADFLLAPEEMPERIAAYAAQLRKFDEERRREESAEAISAALGRVAAILRNKTGHDFHGYKTGTFLRRIQRRMQVHLIDELELYIEYLRDQPDEVQNLFNDLLIGVTQFFRDPKEFELIEREVIPKIFQGKGAGDQVRVWVLGCATGEEAYSIGILMREHLATMDQAPSVQIFATDIDGRALAAARVGRYAKSIANDVAPERLARWFVKEGDTYCVVKELREMCIFSSHNVIKDAPFSRLSLVSCRNLLIYLSSELQARVIPLFHFALQPDGFLFLGNSENATRHAKQFEPIEPRSRIFRRLNGEPGALPSFPIMRVPQLRADLVAASTRPPEGILARHADRIVARFTPAYVIVDAGTQIVHFSGRMERFLGPSSGAASLDLLNLIHRDLRADLRLALQKAIDTDAPAATAGVTIPVQGVDSLVEVSVEPIPERAGGARHFVVVFRDSAAPPHAPTPDGAHHAFHEQIERLEADLRLSRERLQATVEELESTNEELKSSNEEYQSLNEELQSANEELETSKEELQSINEELTTVNGELSHRVNELTRATSDLKNFLENTQIATVFLDNDHRIMNFTPAATELFHLVESDLGRPLSHIKARIPVEELYADVQKVQRTLASVERPVEDPHENTRYIARVLPYRSVDNFIAGVVVTFTNVTAITRAEQALRESETRFRAIFESAAEYAVITTDAKRVITAWNRAAETTFGWARSEVVGRDLAVIYTEEDVAAGVVDGEVEAAARSGSSIDERWHRRKDGRVFWGSGTLTLLRDAELIGYVKILRDETESRAMVERQRMLLAELQHRVRNTLAVIRSIARMTGKSADTVEDFARNLDGRLSAFARVQASLTRDPSEGIDLDFLVMDELVAYHSQDPSRVSIEGPPLRLHSKAAESLALAIHELATNAAKYGGLSVPDGRVVVAWSISDRGARPWVTLSWTEDGLKMSGPPTRRGFGTELLERSLTYSLGAEINLDFAPEGLRCTLAFPIGGSPATPYGD